MLPIIIVSVGVAGIFLFAGVTRNHGWFLSDQICQQGAFICDNPSLVFICIGVIALILSIRAVVKT